MIRVENFIIFDALCCETRGIFIVCSFKEIPCVIVPGTVLALNYFHFGNSCLNLLFAFFVCQPVPLSLCHRRLGMTHLRIPIVLYSLSASNSMTL